MRAAAILPRRATPTAPRWLDRSPGRTPPSPHFVDTCHGGCAGRRELAGGVEMPDPYCPLVRGETVDLDWAPAEQRELLKTGSACTTVFAPR